MLSHRVKRLRHLSVFLCSHGSSKWFGVHSGLLLQLWSVPSPSPRTVPTAGGSPRRWVLKSRSGASKLTWRCGAVHGVPCHARPTLARRDDKCDPDNPKKSLPPCDARSIRNIFFEQIHQKSRDFHPNCYVCQLLQISGRKSPRHATAC
jgi:hypothetical protein